MAEINDIGSEWININSYLSIQTGTRLLLTNIGNEPIRMHEGTVQPTIELGKPLTTKNHHYMEAEVVEGSLDIWVRSSRGDKHPANLEVQLW